jgi:hypothetical protein
MTLADDLLAGGGAAGFRLLNLSRGRHVGNLHRAAADDRTPAGAGAELGKGHSDRHRILFLSRCRRVVDRSPGLRSHLFARNKRPKLYEGGNCVNRVHLSDSGNIAAESTLKTVTVPK